MFIESNYQNAAFLSDGNWLNDLAFLTDITQNLSEMNLKLQERHLLVNILFEHICALEKKFELSQFQLGRATLTHFMCLSVRKMEFPDIYSTNYAASVQKLCDELTSRFPDFR